MDSGYHKHSINGQWLVVSGGSDNCFRTSYYCGSHSHETSLTCALHCTLRLTLVAILAPGLRAAGLEAGGRGHDGGDGLTLLRGEVTPRPQVSPGQPREDGVQLWVTGDQLLQQILGQQLLLWLGHV